jgi:hypothetical protein
MLALVSGLVIAGAIAWGLAGIAAELKAARSAAARRDVLDVLNTFAPASSAAAADPRAVLVWEPLARMARQVFPDEFTALDRASGVPFPFGSDRIQAAHAQWTAEWLAWERSHDAAYKLKASETEEELMRAGESALLRARLESIEREKLELYQRRYEEYVRVAKALQALI